MPRKKLKLDLDPRKIQWQAAGTGVINKFSEATALADKVSKDLGLNEQNKKLFEILLHNVFLLSQSLPEKEIQTRAKYICDCLKKLCYLDKQINKYYVVEKFIYLLGYCKFDLPIFTSLITIYSKNKHKFPNGYSIVSFFRAFAQLALVDKHKFSIILAKFVKLSNFILLQKINDAEKSNFLIDFNVACLTDLSDKDLFKIATLLSGPFGQQRVNEFIVSRQNGFRDEWFKIKSQMSKDGIAMFYSKGQVLRKGLSLTSYAIWKDLYQLGLPVEEINGIRSIDDFSITVLSKAKGISLSKIALEKLPLYIKLNIISQIIKIMLVVWSRGYIFGHCHFGNFTLNYISGNPQITLIDFSEAHKMNLAQHNNDPISFSEEFYTEVWDVASMLAELSPKLQNDTEGYFHILMNMFTKRISK